MPSRIVLTGPTYRDLYTHLLKENAENVAFLFTDAEVVEDSVGDWAEVGVEPTVPVGAEAGVSVGTGVVAVGSGVGADESLQALRTPAMPRIVRTVSQQTRR